MGGGAWKVAYADFVTAMMAFFLLLWILSMVPPDTKAGLAAYFSGERNFDSSSTSPISTIRSSRTRIKLTRATSKSTKLKSRTMP